MMTPTRAGRFVGVLIISLGWACSPVLAYTVTNLVSDQAGVATLTDPKLVNPWGMTFSATSPIWSANNMSGSSTLYAITGANGTTVAKNALEVSMANAAHITGNVFNGTTDFNAYHFIFAAEDGSINAWKTGTAADQPVLPSAANVYKGLAIGNNGTGNFLYAANFRAGTIDVYNTSFAPVTLSGGFADGSLPTGYAPFDVQNLGGSLYVTYALQDATKSVDVHGPGNGFVDKFDLNGNLLGRLVSNGNLNSPWGIAIAPATFGAVGGDLLVGNFGDGRINAYNPATGAFVDSLRDASNTPITEGGLWALAFGNGGNGGATNTLYFTAGPGGETHGLLGAINVPEPTLVSLLILAMPFLCGRGRRRKSQT